MNKNRQYFEIDIIEVLKALWKKAWLIVIVALLCAGLGFSYASFYLQPTYESSVLMFVNTNSVSIGGTSLSISPSELSLASSLVNTYIAILKTRMTLTDVAKEAGVSYSYEQLNNMISASAVNSTQIFRITVTSSDPYEAERIANTITYVLPDKISDIINGCSARTVDYAVAATSKSGPSISKYTAISGIAGVVLICAVIIVLHIMDDVIHDTDYLTNTYDIPVLAEIPDLDIGSKSSSRNGYGYGYGSNSRSSGKEKQQ